MNILTYRQEIMNELMSRTKPNGTPAIDETSAITLLNALTDEELEEGMPFNTPKDVADVLIESNNLK